MGFVFDKVLKYKVSMFSRVSGSKAEPLADTKED